jgi:hypothetical protein
MAERFDLRFEITREDWIGANETLHRISPYWAVEGRKRRRAALRQVLWMSPFIVGGAAMLIGHGSSTRGMYGEGALMGLLLVGLMAWGLPRIDPLARARIASLDQIRRMDLSSHVGPVRVAMDEQGVEISAPSREFKLSWLAVTPHDIGEYVTLSHGGADGTIIPKRAFASRDEAAAFVAQGIKWWQAGQRPGAERLALYLSDRDLACPKCGYNLRGVGGDTCPECGEKLTFERLSAK